MIFSAYRLAYTRKVREAMADAQKQLANERYDVWIRVAVDLQRNRLFTGFTVFGNGFLYQKKKSCKKIIKDTFFATRFPCAFVADLHSEFVRPRAHVY